MDAAHVPPEPTSRRDSPRFVPGQRSLRAADITDLGLDLDHEEAPRFGVEGQHVDPSRTEGPGDLHFGHDDPTRLSAETVRDELARRGHPIHTVGDLDGPCSVEIIRGLPDGALLAGSDPRRDGWALAW